MLRILPVVATLSCVSLATASGLVLSGRVLAPDSTAKAGVTVTLASTGAVATTDADGAWSTSAAVGIKASGGPDRAAGRLTVEGNRPRIRYGGAELSGRRASAGKGEVVAGGRAAGRIASDVDTLVYAFGGKVFLRDTVSADRADMVRFFDTTWNAAIVYGELSDSRDGQLYRTVRIGAQVWMAENLNFVADSSWCYGDSSASCLRYGRLYQWSAATGLDDSCDVSACAGQLSTKVQGACPAGWHVPSNAEWTVLVTFLGGDAVAGAKLKAASGWASGAKGTDLHGFRALPGGYIYEAGDGYHHGYASYIGNWWSGTESEQFGAWVRTAMYNSHEASLEGGYKNSGRSLRCLQD